MAEVGVLNLTIKDNSEKAGQGLSSLAGALTAVKTALKDFDLSPVGQQVTQLAKTIQEAKGTSTIVKNLGTMFNSINQFSKIKSFTIDTEKIRSMAENMLKLADAKERVDEATKTGAGVSDWRSSMGAISESTEQAKKSMEDAAESITKSSHRIFSLQLFGRPKSSKQVPGQTMMDLDGTAQKINEVVQKMQVTDAVVQKVTEHVSSATGKFETAIKSDDVISPVQKIGEAFQSSDKYIRYYSSAIDAVIPKINQLSSEHMIEAGNARLAAMSEKELRVALLDAQGELPRLAKVTHAPVDIEQVESVKEFTIALQETGDVIESVVIPRFQRMYQIWSMMAYEFNAFSMQASRLMGGSSPLLLGDGKTPGQLLLGDGSDQQTFLSTWVQTGEQWKQNWVYYSEEAAEQSKKFFSPDWIMDDNWKKNMYQTMVDMYNNFNWFNTQGPMLMSGEEPLRLYGEIEQLSDTSAAVDGVESVAKVIDETTQSSKEAVSSLDDFFNSLNKLDLLKQLRDVMTKELAKGMFSGEFDDKKIINYQIRIQNLTEQINKLEDAERRASEEAVNMAKDKISEYMNYNEIELTKQKLDEMTDAIARQYSAGKLNEQQFIEKIGVLQKLRDKLQELQDEEERTTSVAGRLSSAWQGFKGAIERMFPTLTSLIKRFGQIAKYRMLRSVLKHITAGFTEGVKNVYQYSKAVGTDLAPAMDQAATSLQQMKNSIGAAVAPVIQALVPVLQNVVNWFINLINYANQFFALINGQSTWTRALPEQAEAFEKSTKSAKGASKAMKDLLADWDELNIIQSNSSSGGSSGTEKTAEEYKNMFEEVSEFNDAVKDVVAFIDEHLGGIPGLLKKAGAVLLGWKLSKAFASDLAGLKNLSVAAGLTLMIAGVTFASEAGYSIGRNGLNPQNLLEGVGGVLATSIGGGLIGLRFGGVVGGLIGLTVGLELSLVVLAFKMNQGEKDSLYGDIKLTAEEIQAEVNKLFKVDVNAEVENAKADEASITAAKKTLETDIRNMNADWVTFRMNVTPASADALAQSVASTVSSANALLTEYQKQISLGFGFETNFDDPEYVQKFETTNISGLDKYVSELGNRIGTLLEESTKAGFDEWDLLEDLQRKLSNVTRAIEIGKASSEFTLGLEEGNEKRDWTNADRQSIIDYAKRYYEQVEDAKEAGRIQAMNEKSALGGIYAGMLQREKDEPGTYTEEALAEAKRAYEEYDVQKTIDEYVAGVTGEGKKIFLENLMTALGGAVEKLEEKGGFRTDLGTKGTGSLADMQTSLMTWLQQNLAVNLGWGDVYGDEIGQEFVKTLNAMESTGWDMLSEKMRKRYLDTIIKVLGSNSDTYTRIKDELKIPVDEILTLDKTDWNKWSGKEQMQYIAALSKAYGGREVIEAFKKAGYTVEDLLDASSYFTEGTRTSFEQALEEVFEQPIDLPEIKAKSNGVSIINEDVINRENLLPDWLLYHAPTEDEMQQAQQTQQQSKYWKTWDDWNIVPEFLQYQPPTAEELKQIQEAQQKKVDESGAKEKSKELLGDMIVTTYDGFTFDDSDINDLYRHINWTLADAGYEGDNRAKFQKAVNELLASGSLEIMQELLEKINEYGVVDAFDMLKNYLQGDDWTLGRNGAKRFTANNFSTSMGAFTNRYDTNPSDPYAWSDNGLVQIGRQFAEAENELTADDVSKAVETGTTNANRDQNDILNSIMRGVEALLRKNWTVNITPTSALGNVNRGAAAAIERITGTIG